MRILIIILALFSMDLMGQELLERSHWPDGTLHTMRVAVGNRVHFYTYHENGHLRESGAYYNGRCDGVWKRYTDTGTLLLHASFQKGTRVGTWEFRSPDDRPMGRLHFDDGTLAYGEQYDQLGHLIASREY